MIVEVAVGSALVAAAAFVWRRVHEKRAMEKRTEDGDAAKPAEKKAEAKPKAEPKKPAEKPSA
ncbi:MAG: hypothetical protein R3B99_07790 [Polyangiales bacterium]